jgi:hypothetical protein
LAASGLDGLVVVAQHGVGGGQAVVSGAQRHGRCSGFAGRRAGGLGGQEQGGQDGCGGGDGGGDAADGQAVQECAGGGVLEGPSEGRVAEGGDLAGGAGGRTYCDPGPNARPRTAEFSPSAPITRPNRRGRAFSKVTVTPSSSWSSLRAVPSNRYSVAGAVAS